MLIVDESGSIEHANKAASDFYGYTVDQLEKMNMNQINMHPGKEIDPDNKSLCIFEQKLSNGNIRMVEAYSYPHKDDIKTVYLVTINDITERVQADQKQTKATVLIFLILFIIIMVISILINILYKNLIKLKLRNHDI